MGGFHFNRDLLIAAVANTYLETVGTRSDLIHPAVQWKRPLNFDQKRPLKIDQVGGLKLTTLFLMKRDKGDAGWDGWYIIRRDERQGNEHK